MNPLGNSYPPKATLGAPAPAAAPPAAAKQAPSTRASASAATAPAATAASDHLSYHKDVHASRQADRDAARRARDGARPPAAPPASPAPLVATSPGDLVVAAVTPASPGWGDDVALDVTLSERGVALQLGSVSFAAALGGSARLTANVSVTGAAPPELHDWACRRCHSGYPPHWTCSPPGGHDFHCNRCGTGIDESLSPSNNVAAECVPAKLPSISARFAASTSLDVDLAALGHRLFVALDAQALTTSIPSVGGALGDGYGDALRQAFETLTSALPAHDAFQAAFDQALSDGPDALVGQLSRDAVQALNGLLGAVIDFAQGQLDRLDELFTKVVQFLSLVLAEARGLVGFVSVRDLIARAGDTVAAVLAQADDRLLAAWQLAGWLVSFCLETDQAALQGLLAKLLLATKDQYEEHRAQVELLLDDTLHALAQRGSDALAFATTLLAALRDGAGDVASSAKFLVSVGVAAAAGVADAAGRELASVLGSLVGLVLGALDRAGHDLGQTLEALVAELEDAHRLAGDEVKVFLTSLGDDALLKKCVRWIHDEWSLFVKLVREGAAELWAWIQMVLQVIEQVVADASGFAELDRLLAILNWLQALPNTLLAFPELDGIQEKLEGAKETIQAGILPWLNAQAAATGKDVDEYARKLITDLNPIATIRKRVASAILQVLGDVPGTGAELVAKYTEAFQDLRDFETTLWGYLFSGGLDEGPFTAYVKAHGLLAQPLSISGGQVSTDPPTGMSDALASGESFAGSLAANTAPDASFLGFDVVGEKLRVPHPCDTKPIVLPTGRSPLPFDPPVIPLALPLPWDASVAIAHLPELYTIDMRYHFPYGDLGCYHVADLDKDGFVRHWEVQKLRDAVSKAKTKDFYEFALDCDGDGQITENDVQLAIEQQSNYVNGLMYRKKTAPLGFLVSPAPSVWCFVAITDLTQESIPNGIQRRGIMLLCDGQLIVPIPNINYPLRYHYEERYFVDQFDNLKVVVPGLEPLTASMRYDLVLRGGATGRDFQIYCTSEPMNPVLRTWNLKGTLYLKGMASAGLAAAAGLGGSAGGGGKGGAFIHVSYETTAPLIEVMEEWYDLVQDISETDVGALPVPWKFIQGLLEWTDIPKLFRALIRIGGPLADLLFDWCDDGHKVRAALGYIRQYVLNQWTPAPTWEQLAHEISTTWTDIAPAERNAILAALEGVRASVVDPRTSVAAGLEDPVYVPAHIARRCRSELAKLHAAQPGALTRGKRPRALAPASATATTMPLVPPGSRAVERVKACFEDGCGRFAASLDQLVPEGPPDPNDPLGRPAPFADAVTVPLCGDFKVLKPFVAGFPYKLDELEGARPDEATLDDLLSVRGNPFYKPIYHAIIELGPEAKLYTAPSRDANFFTASAAGQKGVVEGSRVLEDPDGNRWLWVRTESWAHGWVFVDAAVCAEIFSLKASAEVVGNDLAESLVQDLLGKVADAGVPVSVLDPDKINHKLDDLLAKLERKGQRPTITKLEAPPKETADESRYARLCRAAVARASVHGAQGADADYLAKYDVAMKELTTRMFGVGANESADELAKAFNKLTLVKREKLWAAGTAWIKLQEYMPIVLDAYVAAIFPLVIQRKFDEAWNKLLEMLRMSTKVQLEDVILMAQTCAPAVKDVVSAVIDIGTKLSSIKDEIAGHDGKAAGSGSIPAANDPDKVTWKNLPEKLLRIFIDDEEEPGRPATPKKKARGLRQNHDAGISFSFEVTAKLDAPDAGTAPKPKNEYRVALAEPWVVKIEQRTSDESDDGSDDDSQPDDTTASSPDDAAAGAGSPGAGEELGSEDDGTDERAEGEGTEGGGAEGDATQGDRTESDGADGAGQSGSAGDASDDEDPEDDGSKDLPQVGDVIELQVTEWGAFVYTDPPTARFDVDSGRIPKELKAALGWEVSTQNGADGSWVKVDAIPGQDEEPFGERLRFTVTEDYAGKPLLFRTYYKAFDWRSVGKSDDGDGGPVDANGPDASGEASA